ncbi:hypothetical protein O9993_23025 [Vibrio lentus]|nr:hypothetical protein [Vibrio lentus]
MCTTSLTVLFTNKAGTHDCHGVPLVPMKSQQLKAALGWVGTWVLSKFQLISQLKWNAKEGVAKRSSGMLNLI